MSGISIQRHPIVPSSNSPPIPEWAGHFWYVLRCSALQASETLSEAAAQQLVNSFEAYAVTLPCPDCRAHYEADWAVFPFTLAHAKSAAEAMKWVEDLRIRIDGRTGKTRTAVAKPSPVSVTADKVTKATPPPFVPKPAGTLRMQGVFGRGSVGIPNKYTLSLSSVQAAVAAKQTREAASAAIRGTSSPSGDAMKRNVAIQSALKETAANRMGPRGCNCGRKR